MADEYASNFTEITEPDGTELIPAIADPGGTPLNRGILLNTILRKSVNGPYQWLSGSVVGGAARPQMIPSGVWVPVHWGTVHADTFTNRPLEGSVSSNVGAAVTLTPTGSHVIEIAAGGIAAAGLRTPTGARWEWLVIEDTVNLLSQVVRYTGLSAGTGGSGRDRITGVSLGSWSLTAGTQFNVRQAAPQLMAYTHANRGMGDRYLLVSQCPIAFGGDLTETGWRDARYTSIPASFPVQLPVYYSPSVPGGWNDNFPDGDQHLMVTGQPGVSQNSSEIIEVKHSAGYDLPLVRGGLPAHPIAMQYASDALEAP